MAGEISVVGVSRSAFSRNAIDVEVSHTDANTWVGGTRDLTVEYSIDEGATWSQAGVWTGAANFCAGQSTDFNAVNAFSSSTLSNFTIYAPDDIPHNTLIRVRVKANSADGDFTESIDARTWDYPEFLCGTQNVTADSAKLGINDNSPTGQTNVADCGADSIVWEYGTTPGGPYTTQLPAEPVTGFSPTKDVTGLAPSTTYYYRARLSEPDTDTHAEYLVTAECSFTTLDAAGNNEQCTDATAITSGGATIGGTADNVDPANSVVVAWGTNNGGPYPNVAGSVAGDNSIGQVVSGPVAGIAPSTTVWYRVEIRDGSNNVLSSGEQCSFTTLAASLNPECGPTGNVTTTGATLTGKADSVTAQQSIRIQYGTVSGGPYGTTAGATEPGTNTVDQPISRPVAGLTPATVYYYVVQVLDIDGVTVLATSTQCTFTTPAEPPVVDPPAFVPTPCADCGTGSGAAAEACDPVTTTGLCLGDGTPIATVSQRDCDTGEISHAGWINLTTGAFTAGPVPVGAQACGAGQNIQNSGVLCDVDGGGNTVALVVIEYTYNADGSIASTQPINAVTGADYVPVGTITICNGGDAFVFGYESICYTLTSTGDAIHVGTKRHDDRLPAPGFLVFDSTGNPVNTGLDGYTQVPCQPSDQLVNYASSARDAAGGAPYTIQPATAGGALTSWNVRNRNATTATVQVNGGPVLPLDTGETIGSDLTGADPNDVLNDTVVVNPGDGAVRVIEVRRAP